LHKVFNFSPAGYLTFLVLVKLGVAVFFF